MRYVRTTEGRTKLLVPSVSLERAEPPTTPVFFNPAAAMNRDISAAITGAASGTSFCDALAGVGARGIRVAKEVGREMAVTMVDFNKAALRLARKNALLNSVARRCDIVDAETNSFLHSRFRRDEKFDFVDVDPFGTPVPYLPAAFNAVSDGGVVSITATDTAVLCGVYPRVAQRRYGARTMNNSFHHETAVRVLMGFLRRTAAALDIGISPIAAHVTKHYVRVYLQANVGATRADGGLAFEGYVMACPDCMRHSSTQEYSAVCPSCGRKASCAGPLWTGNLVDESLVRKAAGLCEEERFASAAKTLRSIIGVDNFPPFSFDLAQVCSRLKLPGVSQSRVAEALRERGFRSQAQPFEKSGLKTDAPYQEVESAVKAA
jgi:tRNA (guanine26-N2/guanine27-N2)-dimethyltransferase